MNIYLNSDLVKLDQNPSLFDLLQVKEFSSKKGIAVAINNNVISRQEWETTMLAENDKVLVIAATQGG